ncbi:FAD-dependent oxidoreductase [Geodermatophilus sp. SYSU D00691]
MLNTGPGAVAHAQQIRQWSDNVVFFAHTHPLTATERGQLRARGIQVVLGEVTQLVVEDDQLTGVQLSDGRVAPRSAVFIRPGNAPYPDGPLTALGCRTDEAGSVTVDATGRTSTAGVGAAGNVVDPLGQVIAAAGAGEHRGDRDQRRPDRRRHRPRGR